MTHINTPISTESTAEPTVHRSRRRAVRALLLIVVPVLAAFVAGIVYLKSGRYIETENAYVEADKVPISAEVSGTVSAVLVAENQLVHAGQPLFRLDPASFQLAVAKADAKLAQVITEQAALKATYHEKQAEISLGRTRQDFAQKEQRRQADLVAKGFVSVAKFDDAKQNTELAQQQIGALEQDLKRIAASLGGSIDMAVQRHPSYRAAQAELDQAKLDLARIEVRASMAGTVSKPPKPGQYLGAGSTVMALIVSGNPWVEANLTETDLTYVHPGQPVTIHIDTYPDAVLQGVVESLSPATGAEFSVIPAQNATGNWVKITQRVAVRITLQAAPNLPPLRSGLSTSVKIDTGHSRHFLGLSL